MTAPKKLVGCSDTMSYVEKLREEDFGQLVKFCKMHIATVVEMDSDQFEGLFAQQQSSVITPSSNFRQNLTAMLPKKRGRELFEMWMTFELQFNMVFVTSLVTELVLIR